MIKLSLRLAMPALALLVALNCAAGAQDKLRIAGGLAGTWENSFSELGQNAGFFKKHGLVLEIFYTQGAGETQQAVISGSAERRVMLWNGPMVADCVGRVPVRRHHLVGGANGAPSRPS